MQNADKMLFLFENTKQIKCQRSDGTHIQRLEINTKVRETEKTQKNDGSETTKFDFLHKMMIFLEKMRVH